MTADGEHWGAVNIREYRHYDDPCNGDLHEVVPGRFIAFQGPKDLGGRDYRDDARGHRAFSPSFYAALFAEDLGVAAVVRLNEADYDAAGFEAAGIRHHHLEFADCARPPARVAAAFLAAADAALGAGGAVAVHCRAGLGRTGTLIALYLMRSCGFGAREAMGWLRVMRPGSVIGEQQHYLCAADAVTCPRGSALPCHDLDMRSIALTDRLHAGRVSEARRSEEASCLAASVAEGVQLRDARRSPPPAKGRGCC